MRSQHCWISSNCRHILSLWEGWNKKMNQWSLTSSGNSPISSHSSFSTCCNACNYSACAKRDLGHCNARLHSELLSLTLTLKQGYKYKCSGSPSVCSVCYCANAITEQCVQICWPDCSKLSLHKLKIDFLSLLSELRHCHKKNLYSRSH